MHNYNFYHDLIMLSQMVSRTTEANIKHIENEKCFLAYQYQQLLDEHTLLLKKLQL